jgi:Protein of unknown function (DUF3179)
MRFGPLILLLSLARAGFAVEPETFIAKPEAFRTLVNPECSHCKIEAKRRASELRDDDRALCWIRGYADGGAIPMRFFLNSYRVISDSYGVFVYDPDAGFARGFEPSYDFAFQGWRNGVMVMKHKDGTLYSCLTGLAFDGPKKGERLKPIPTLVTSWGYWLKRYPDTVAYNMFDKYRPTELPTAIDDDSQKSRIPSDKRLGAQRQILGFFDRGNPKAYPLDALAEAGLIKEVDDGESRAVLWYEPTHTAAAYRPVATPPSEQGKVKARTVTLDLRDKEATAPFVDKETGSRWDIAGRAVEGELKGWTLEWLDGTQVKWFAWAAEYPASSIYQANGTSQ